ncbi:MAG: 30S ribosomal protein S8 [Candidatus Woesearchaeota archaeon]
MSLNDSLAMALSKVSNAEKVSKTEVVVEPSSKTLKAVLDIFRNSMYVGEYTEEETPKGTKLTIQLVGNINKCGAIKPRASFAFTDIDSVEKRFLPAKGFGIVVVSTPDGLMTLTECREKRIGGRLIAYCY